MSGPSTHPDVFVAFHPADADWVKGLVRFLQAHHLSVASELDLLPGDNRLQHLEQALANARRLILVISPESMADALVELERHAMLIRAIQRGSRERLTLPVILHPAPLPPTLHVLANCNLFDVDEGGYREQLRQLLSAIPTQTPSANPLKTGVALPPHPPPVRTDALWAQLLEIYGELTHDEGKTLILAKHAVATKVLPHREILETLSGDTAANLYLTRLGNRENRAQRILEDLRALSPRLRHATRFDETVDALEKALQSNKPAGSDGPAFVATPLTFDQQLVAYQRATLSQHAHIPLIGVNPELKLTLGIDDVYVPLHAQIHRSIYHEDKWHTKHPVSPSDERGMESTDIDLAEAFKCASGKRGVVILGDPGSGKTTLLKLLLVRCIRDGAESLGLPRDVVPVMLPLRDLKGDKNLDEFFQRSLSENPHLTLPPDFARALRESRPLLYLLDGLDEVPDQDERASVSRWIHSALKTHTNVRFAVTSRYAGYQGEARLDDHFVELNVRALKEAEAKALVQNFYRIVEKSQNADAAVAHVNANQKAAHLWSLLESDQHRTRRMRELQVNPLLLTILCLVHQRYDDLPDRRWRLYEQCVDTLVWHWRKAVRIELPFKLEDSRKLLLPLAYWLHQEKERRHATADEVVSALAEPLSQLAVTPEVMRQFLKDVRDRSGLLVGWGRDSYGFIHLAFQEHLTAMQLKITSHGHLEVLDEAARHFGESWWTEVILLLVSLPEPSMFEPFMRRVVMQDTFAQLEHRALLADCVADASVKSPLPFLEVVTDPARTEDTKLAALWALRGMKEEQKARVIEVCLTLVDSPNPQLRAQARELLEARGEKVATRLSQKLEAGTIWIHRATGLEFVYVPPGSFKMGSTRSGSAQPMHTVTFKRGFWIGKYPVTNAQYERFMKATQHMEPGSWKDSQFNGAEQPVVGVDWNDAKAYCQWADTVLRAGLDLPPADFEMIVLPSEAEWEYAARGPKALEYPWGNTPPTAELANFERKVGRTTPVGQYPKGASWVGALDMAGNVWEWCADPWHKNYQGAPKDGKPWMNNPAVPDVYSKSEEDPQKLEVVRGGSWNVSAGGVRSACRFRRYAWDWDRYRGFRVLAAAFPGGDTRAVDT